MKNEEFAFLHSKFEIRNSISSYLRERTRLPRAASEVINERAGVDDENDLALADLRRAGDAGRRFQSPADRLDHDLLLPHERIDEDADALLPRPRHDDEPLRVGTVIAAVFEIGRASCRERGEIS